MKKRILFIERKSKDFSIENVFRQVAKNLSGDNFEIAFEQVPYGSNLLDIVKNLLFFRRKPADIYHLTGHVHYMALRLPADKTVLTIHDLRILHERRGLRRFILKKLFLDWPVKKLRHITAISQQTKHEIVVNTNCDSNKVSVIDNPLFEGFDSPGSKAMNTACPVILQIGYTQNKNIPNLIRALAGLNCKLVIIGRDDIDQRQLLTENKIDFEIKQGLDQTQLVDEYQNSDIVAFCSTYEGFGLPIIEAQALGKPVITSDLSPMKEVSGGAAVLVNPNDVADIREGIVKLINDAELRTRLIEAGFENVRRFDPRVISKRYENYYLKIVGAPKNGT